MAPQRGGTSKSVQYFEFFHNYPLWCLQNNILVCFLLYLVEIYYQQNVNIARGLTYDPHYMHYDWTIKPCHCGLLIRRQSGIGGVAEFSQSNGDISGSPQVASKFSLWDYSWCIISCMKTDLEELLREPEDSLLPPLNRVLASLGGYN